MIERAQLGGVGIPETKLALYHTRDDDVLSPTFTIYRLNKPIELTGMDGNLMATDTVLLMLSPQSVNQEVLEIMSLISSLVIQEPKTIELFEEADGEAIKQFLSEHFFNYVQQKQVRSMDYV
ncbi:PTS sugar transporter subunit IIA [Pradoshia sp.]